LHVVLIARLDVLVVKDTAEFPYAIPCVVSLNVVNDIVVRNNFFILVIDETLELDAFGLFLEVVLGKVVVNKGNDFGPVSCTVIFRWHEESAVKHLVGGSELGRTGLSVCRV